LVNDQRDAQILFYVFISIYNSLHVSSTQCSSSWWWARWPFTKNHYMMHGQQNVNVWYLSTLPIAKLTQRRW